MQHLVDAYTQYAAAMDAHAAKYPFDLMTFMDAPEAPRQSPEARAGELIHEGGLMYAMRNMLLMAAERPLNDHEQQVASLLAIASVEA